MPRTLTSIVAHHSSTSTSHSGPIGPRTPALLTRTSIGTERRRAARRRPWPSSSASVTSARADGDDAAGRLDHRAVAASSSADRATSPTDGAASGEARRQQSADASAGAGDQATVPARSAVGEVRIVVRVVVMIASLGWRGPSGPGRVIMRNDHTAAPEYRVLNSRGRNRGVLMPSHPTERPRTRAGPWT